MIGLPGGARIWIACGVTDLRNGFDGLAGLVQTQLTEDPFSGQLFVFRGRRGDRIKMIWWDGDGLCLFRQETRARPLRLAASRHRDGAFERSAVIDAARGDRLETAAEDARAAARGVNNACFIGISRASGARCE